MEANVLTLPVCKKKCIQCTGIESDNIAYVLPKEMNNMGKMGTTKHYFF